MSKEDVVSTYMVNYSAIKMNETLPFAITWMSLEGIKFSEISQTEKDQPNRLITRNEIEYVIKILHTNESPGPENLTVEFCQTFREALTPLL